MDMSTFKTRPHQSPPSGEQINAIFQKYGYDPIAGADLTRQVTKQELNRYAFGAGAKARDEFDAVSAGSGLTKVKAIARFVTGTGEYGNYEQMLNELARASGDAPTSSVDDLAANQRLVMEALGTKVKDWWNHVEPKLEDLVGKLFTFGPDGTPSAPDAEAMKALLAEVDKSSQPPS